MGQLIICHTPKNTGSMIIYKNLPYQGKFKSWFGVYQLVMWESHRVTLWHKAACHFSGDGWETTHLWYLTVIPRSPWGWFCLYNYWVYRMKRTCLKCVRSWENCHLGPLIPQGKKDSCRPVHWGSLTSRRLSRLNTPHSLQRLCTSHSWKLPLLPGQREWKARRVPWNRHHMEPTTRSHETPKHPMDGLRAGGIHCLSVEYHKLPSGKRLHNYGKSPFPIGKSTIINGQFSIATLNYQRVHPRKGRKQLLQAALANSGYCKIHQNPTFCWPYKPPVIPLPKIHTEKGHPLLQLSGSCLSWDQRIRSSFYCPPLDLLGSPSPRKSRHPGGGWWTFHGQNQQHHLKQSQVSEPKHVVPSQTKNTFENFSGPLRNASLSQKAFSAERVKVITLKKPLKWWLNSRSTKNRIRFWNPVGRLSQVTTVV